jgi:hypothetical protein
VVNSTVFQNKCTFLSFLCFFFPGTSFSIRYIVRNYNDIKIHIFRTSSVLFFWPMLLCMGVYSKCNQAIFQLAWPDSPDSDCEDTDGVLDLFL